MNKKQFSQKLKLSTLLSIFFIFTNCSVEASDNSIKLVSNGFTNFVIMENGTLWAWGSNRSGLFGNGTTNEERITTPIQIGNETNWVSLSVGYGHVVAIKKDGTLWAWGDNSSGQLGNGTTTNSRIPVRIETETNWATVSAGQRHTIAIKKDGSLWAWGNNFWGQLGTGGTTEWNGIVNRPVRVGTDSNWEMISTAGGYNVAIKRDGTLWEWGFYSSDIYRTSGLGIFVPTQVGSENDWLTVSAAGDYAIAIKENGSLWYWKFDISETPRTFTRNFPLQIGRNNNWNYISSNRSDSIAIDRENNIWIFNIGYELFEQEFEDENENIMESNWVLAVFNINGLIAIRNDNTIWTQTGFFSNVLIKIMP